MREKSTELDNCEPKHSLQLSFYLCPACLYTRLNSKSHPFGLFLRLEFYYIYWGGPSGDVLIGHLCMTNIVMLVNDSNGDAARGG